VKDLHYGYQIEVQAMAATGAGRRARGDRAKREVATKRRRAANRHARRRR
jgi:hypothetical protein